MKDKNDRYTEDFIEAAALKFVEASALKSEKGTLQLPVKAENLLMTIAIHAATEGRNPVDLIQDIHDATSFWLYDHDMRQNSEDVTHYTGGRN